MSSAKRLAYYKPFYKFCQPPVELLVKMHCCQIHRVVDAYQTGMVKLGEQVMGVEKTACLTTSGKGQFSGWKEVVLLPLQGLVAQWQSGRLITDWSQVRILPSPLNLSAGSTPGLFFNRVGKLT